ncbi:MAG TPA: carbohydrate kinase [Terriglobales bacterium]|jgi:fructokinase|nr:carbohydrate kinase [Terriglobales bacterium]
MASKIVGLGELLWDMLPAGKQLGGAPANFAYISTLLGNDGIVASRIGTDPLGDEAVARLETLHVNTSFIEKDATHPTGTVQVTVDHAGQPKFEIAEGVAWDFLDWSSAWQELARQANAVCFGSLAQRNAATRATIRQFLEALPAGAVRIFDVNLRQNFFSREILEDSMQLADVVKLNHEELPRIAQLFGIHHRDEIASADTLMERHDLKLICITRGCNGSLLITSEGLHEHNGYRIQVADTVGAGDAFTAGMVHEYLRGATLPEMNETANRVGAWVASQVGAMPSPGEGGVRAEMARIR